MPRSKQQTLIKHKGSKVPSGIRKSAAPSILNKMLIDTATFKNLVRSVAGEVGYSELEFESGTWVALQKASESYMTRVFQEADRLAEGGVMEGKHLAHARSLLDSSNA
jgi:histone H3/H4